MFFFDPVYFFFVMIPVLVLSAGVQLYLSATFRKWKRVRNSAGEAGPRIAQDLFERTSLQAVPIEGTEGKLSDHFDPRKNVVRLSREVAGEASVASMAIVAHELGHVQQHQSRSVLMVARGFLVPAVTVSPMISYGLIFAGLIFNAMGLVWLGILFFSLVVLFSVLTLPIEIDASRRGIKLLREAGLLQVEADAHGARAVLTAAALTYVAAMVTAVVQLLYLIFVARR